MSIRVAMAIGALLAALGCREVSSLTLGDLGGRGSAWAPDSAAVLALAQHSGFTDSLRTVVGDGAAFAAAWARLYATQAPPPPPPQVDFARDRVLLVAQGQRHSGGFGVTIDSVVAFSAGTVVYVTTVAPGPSCATTLALTQPVELVRVPRPLAPVLFLDRHRITNCP